MDQVSIVIPAYNQLKMTIDCLNDVIKTYGHDIEIIVVDDGSSEPISRVLPKLFPQIKMLTNDKNLGFAKTVNRGIRAASHDYVCLLNNDILLPSSDWLKTMMSFMKRNSLDMTAPAGGRLDAKWNYVPGEAKKTGDDFQYLVGWALLIGPGVFDKIGLMPENFGSGFWDDTLFGYRAKKAGLRMDIVEGTEVQHKYHATFKAEGFDLQKEYAEKRKIFLDIIRSE